jgi:hypothetical protein
MSKKCIIIHYFLSNFLGFTSTCSCLIRVSVVSLAGMWYWSRAMRMAPSVWYWPAIPVWFRYAGECEVRTRQEKACGERDANQSGDHAELDDSSAVETKALHQVAS